MKTTRGLILCVVALLWSAPLVCSQDFSKYRHFSLGMNVTTLLEHTDQKIADAKVVCRQPALIQELTWWPPSLAGTPFRADTVEQILFSFYNGALYKISVTYDRTSTAGLTAEDMEKSISAKYGAAASIAPEVDAATNDRFDVKQKPVASWEDAQYSLELVRSSLSDGFGLVIYSKRVNAEAELAATQAVKLEAQEGPEREAERQKKNADDLEVTRQKNQKIFRP